MKSGTWSGLLDGTPASVDRDGWADSSLRFAVNLYGAPPLAGQAAFLEGLQSISEKQFLHALGTLRHTHGDAAPVASAPALERGADTGGLLLKDATLEDIVRFLHSKNIEPTFRHLIR